MSNPRPDARRPFSRLLFAGLIASVVMGMVEMMLEAIDGEGFWSPVIYIAATVLRDYQTIAPNPGFEALPVLLGLMGHMMNSVFFGLVFASIVPRLVQNRVTLAVVGALYGLVIFATMWYAVIPLVDEVMLRLNAGYFVVAHMMWGIALGVIVGWPSKATVPAPARPTAVPRRARVPPLRPWAALPSSFFPF